MNKPLLPDETDDSEKLRQVAQSELKQYKERIDSPPGVMGLSTVSGNDKYGFSIEAQ